MNAIIIAAGQGTRLKPITNTIPKPMIKVFGKPMIENNIEFLIEAGEVERKLLMLMPLLYPDRMRSLQLISSRR